MKGKVYPHLLLLLQWDLKVGLAILSLLLWVFGGGKTEADEENKGTRPRGAGSRAPGQQDLARGAVK